MNQFGFLRLGCVSLRTFVGNPTANAAEIVRVLPQFAGCDVLVFPELCLTGYTCADLFGQTVLLDAAVDALASVCEATRKVQQLVVVGLPLRVGNSLYNVAAAVAQGRILGVVPKQFIPNYKEFYESRWFSSANGSEPTEVELLGQSVPFGIDLLFTSGQAVVGIEICEDLWMPIPPSSFQAIAGANVLVNLSASNETIGKSVYRTSLVTGQSGRCIAAYGYASAGPTESTTDLVFGGHCLIAENSTLLAESPRVGDGGSLRRDTYGIEADIDLERLQSDRRLTTSFDDCIRHLPGPFRRIPFELGETVSASPSEDRGGLTVKPAKLKREISGTPFVPKENSELHRRCSEIFGIQQAALAKRLEQLPENAVFNIGISGGLDSTLALLAAVKTCDALGRPRSRIRGLTMPGFGTTPHTKENADRLMAELGIERDEIDIRRLSLESFRALSHAPLGIDCRTLSVDDLQALLVQLPPGRQDLVFENVQARLRTFLLMSRGFVIGTGDLSESALGWSTYNGDHISMYNPNCSIPKTLVRFLIRYVAEREFTGAARATLLSIADTTISPELLPPTATGQIAQSTEDTLGPYELHDFFLFHAIRGGCSPAKILYLAGQANFSRDYSSDLIRKTLRTFYRRFFANQFKRTCVPDGPKVGSVSLSPRGDWRMPTDADGFAWSTACDDTRS